MPATAPQSSLGAWVIAFATLGVVAMVLPQATAWYGRPIAGLLLVPDGTVSSIGMPGWSGIEQGLRFPDRVITVDGVAVVSTDGECPARAWDRVVDAAAQRGDESVRARIATSTGERDVDLRLMRLDPTCWWLYGGGTIFTGVLFALAAILAIGASPDGPLARAFAKFATVASLYFLTFFNVHTSRTLVPVFYATFAGVPFVLGALALRLPDDVPLLVRRRWIPRALDVAGALMAVAVVSRDFTGWHGSILPALCTMLLGLALIAFVAMLAIRHHRATGTRRATLAVLLRATATPYVLVGIGMLITTISSRGSITAFFAIPAAALAPLGTGVAFIRHDLWGSRARLSRVLTASVATGIACVIAIGGGAAFAAALGVSFQGALVAAAAGAVMSAGLVNYVTRSVERWFFPAATEYKPTIAQLSEELTSITDPSEVGLAVERTVRRWLPCDRVAFRAVVDAGAGAPAADLPDDLSIPATFGGRVLGVLLVGPKRGDALFTTDDIDLLETIANQAGLALAHAHSYAELEQRRRQQAAAWQTERGALVETVAAEIAHEVRYPINFFRSVFRREPGNTTLDAEEIDIGCEEVERLERLVSGLRRMVGHRIERRVVSVADLAARAEMLLRDVLAGRTLDIDVARDAALRCDTDQVTQVLVNLVANAIDASGARGRIGVNWSTDEEGADLVVWDDGPGFADDPSRLFSPWFTTKPRGTGLGLAITQRIVRAHGWGIDALRADGRTRFVVSVPMSDVVTTDGSAGGESHGSDAMRASVPIDGDHEDTHR